MGALVETIKHNGHEIRIYQDEDPSNPRTEFDNFGRMICFHKRYDFGDKHTETIEQDADDFCAWVTKSKDVVVLPVYMLDHSGLTIRTSAADFRACDPQGWDWGLIGFIYVTKEEIRKEFSVKRVTKKTAEKARNILKGEIKIYDDYLTGNVYGYEIVKESTDEDDEEVIDSCWGFFGDFNEYMLGEAKEIVDSYVKDESNE
jgi:hypothetical protein